MRPPIREIYAGTDLKSHPHSVSRVPIASEPGAKATRRLAPIVIEDSWGDVVDWVDDPEHAPCAVAAGATEAARHDLERIRM